MLTYISDHDDIRALRQELMDARDRHTTTLELLHRAVNTIWHSRLNSHSVGMESIRRWPDTLAEATDDPHAFLLAHIENPHIVRLLNRTDTLALIPDEQDRRDFITAVLQRHTPNHVEWVRVAQWAGIDNREIAEIAFSQLRRTEVDPDSSERDFIRYDFLRLEVQRISANRPRENSLWSVLTEDQLVEALRICSRQAPREFFRASLPHHNPPVTLAQALEAWLPEETVQTLLIEASEQLTSLEELSLDELFRLPRGALTSLARQLNGGSSEFLVRLALTHEHDHALELCARFADRFAEGDAAQNYVRLCPVLDASEHPVTSSIKHRLLEHLRQAGYVLAQVEPYAYDFGPAAVKHEGIWYIQDPLRHLPEDSDWVLFKPQDGHQLGEELFRVIFTPAYPAT